MHIRIGDILCKYIYPHNLRNTPLIYAKKGDTVWWNDVINYIKKNNIKKVVIIAGSLFKKCLKESKDYIEDRIQFLKQNGLKIKYNLGQSPDDDILMCAYVKHFITTGGGYGNLIKQLNKLNKLN